MKLNHDEKVIRKLYREQLREEGGELFSYPELRLTLAIKPCIPGGKAKWYQVSVAQCSKADTFSRKRGELLALYRMDDGESFSVPGRSVEKVAEVVCYMFHDARMAAAEDDFLKAY